MADRQIISIVGSPHLAQAHRSVSAHINAVNKRTSAPNQTRPMVLEMNIAPYVQKQRAQASQSQHLAK